MIPRKLRKMVAMKLAELVKEAEPELAMETLPEFANQPKNISIEFPRRIINSSCMELGDNISLGPNCFLMGIKRYPGPAMNAPQSLPRQTFKPKIFIGSGVTSTGGLQVSAVQKICIEDDVLLATNINMTDCFHGFQNSDIAYKYQALWKIAPITVKKGCWIGQNVVILPGVTIGEYSIVGANSVVTKSVPPRSIAVGAPARIVKQWDQTLRDWESIKK